MTTERVSLSVNPPAAFALPDLSEESANWASIILTENHRIHDMYFNDSGFHNHIVHHITTSYSLGATPSSLQSHYEKNKSYQLPLAPDDGKLAQKLRDGDDDYFISQMGDRSLYSIFLSFFKGEIKERGYALVLNEYLFRGDRRANTIFNRLFAGILHPIIHLGFGVEFEQPAVIAEGLAEACTHGGWSDSFFEEVQDYVNETHPQRKSAKQMLDEIRADEKVSKASRWDDDNHMRDGTLTRARKEAIRHAAAWQVDEQHVEEAAAEMINTAAYFTGAAQRCQHQINFDFFFLHSLNASILIAALLQQDWISMKNKAKLVEWKVRFDVIQYASKRSPDLHLDEIVNYKPEHSGQSDWTHIFARAAKIEDDGHTSKMIRALAYGERCCRPFEDKSSFQMKGPLWLQMANMVMDHAEATDASWIFGAGFDEAWKE